MMEGEYGMWRTDVRMVGRLGEGANKTYLLRTLLLGQHLLLLCHNFRLVFQGQSEGQSHEKRARGYDPHEVADKPRAALDEGRGGRHA